MSKMNSLDLYEAEIWLKQVIKGELCDKQTIQAIKNILKAYNEQHSKLVIVEEICIDVSKWLISEEKAIWEIREAL